MSVQRFEGRKKMKATQPSNKRQWLSLTAPVALLSVVAALAIIATPHGAQASATVNQAGVTVHRQPPAPKVLDSSGTGKSNLGAHNVPNVPNIYILFDQYNSPGSNSTTSQNFESMYDAYDNQLADDFVVPGGNPWTINEVDVAGAYFNGSSGPVSSVNVYFYVDN